MLFHYHLHQHDTHHVELLPQSLKYFEIIPAAVLAVSPSHDQKMMQYILEFHLKSLPEQKTLHSDEKPPVCISCPAGNDPDDYVYKIQHPQKN